MLLPRELTDREVRLSEALTEQLGHPAKVYHECGQWNAVARKWAMHGTGDTPDEAVFDLAFNNDMGEKTS